MKKKMVTTAECISAIQDAMPDLSRYIYYGAREGFVDKMVPFVQRFREMPIQDTLKVLCEVAQFEHGEPFVSYVLSALDDLPEDVFTVLMENEALSGLY